MQKLVALTVLLGLVAVSIALPTLKFAESSHVVKLEQNGYAFCVPVGFKPTGDFQATVQFVFGNPTTLAVRFADTDQRYTEETSTPVHSVAVQTPRGESTAWNSATLKSAGVVAGVVQSKAKLLKVIVQLGAAEETLVADSTGANTCSRWVENADATFGDDDEPRGKPNGGEKPHGNNDNDNDNDNGNKGNGGKDPENPRGPARIFIPTVASVLVLGVIGFLLLTICFCCCRIIRKRRCCQANQAAQAKPDEEMVVLADMHEVPKPTPAPNSPFNVVFAYNPAAAGQQQIPCMPIQMQPQTGPQFYPVMPQYYGYVPVPQQTPQQ